ncbi:8737_t:CDS:2, partial [Gigaspora rosea]
MLRFDLTGNVAVTSDTISRDIEERLRLMLILADPNIVFDLRTYNRFKGTKFNNLLAVNERHHGTILYMPLALSIRDLYETIVDRLKVINNDSLPSNINILSDEWIRLQFCPSNATTTRAMHYTDRFNVKFKYRQWVCLISADDKHKIPIGEDVLISTGIRNRHSIVLQESTLAAANYDFSKLSLTPSVIFFITISNKITELFYDGQVFVLYKDTIFEPSSAIIHLTEFLNVIKMKYAYQEVPTILCLYTDGVQIIVVIMANPAKRIMSTLNLALQGIALKRELMSLESENLFGTASSLEILNNQTERLKLKNNKFKCYSPASQEAITEIFESILRIDPTLKIEETTQTQLRHHSTLIEFINTYCET